MSFRRPYVWLAGFAATVMLLAQAPAELPPPKYPREAPQQPLPFSHKTHAAVAQCNQCHTMPDPGDFALLPATEVCMGCHASIKKDSPHIAKLAEFHADKRRIPWKPVYRIPDWVSFNHKKHIAVAGVTCDSCHGPVAQSIALKREKDLSMQACMDCHRAKGATNECTVCHDPR